MDKKSLAIAVCRVSTPEQRLNNSLTRQELSVRKAAADLGVEIVKFWSGDISSKHGTNLVRRDLKAMKEFCKSNKRVKYLIVDEPDRFMRSIEEAAFFEVEFRQMGVKVWYASDPTLNTDDMMAKMLKFMKFFQAEGSNEERQRKSITGHVAALKEGRYTFPPKPGYAKGPMPGIHQPDNASFIPLQTAFREVISGLYTPLEALKRLNDSGFKERHAEWKMDKFRRYATDPYYAGIVEINKQVKVRNTAGLHQKMLSIDEHEQIRRVFTGSLKARGPKKQYNTEFPLNKVLTCSDCGDNVKFTGSKKSNGFKKANTIYYWKYHCRGCGKSYHRTDVHNAVTETLQRISYTGAQRKQFIEALGMVWSRKQQDQIQTIKATEAKITKLEETKSKLVIELVRVEDEYKSDLKIELDRIKTEIETLKSRNDTDELHKDLISFMKFALEYTNELAEDWWQLSHEDRVRCQQLIIPGGITFNSQKKVGTPIISPIYRLEPTKKDLSFSEKSLMVELVGTAPTSAGLSWLVVYRYSPFSVSRRRVLKRTK